MVMRASAASFLTVFLLLTACSDRSRPEGRAVQLSTLERGKSAHPVELAHVCEKEVVVRGWARAGKGPSRVDRCHDGRHGSNHEIRPLYASEL